MRSGPIYRVLMRSLRFRRLQPRSGYVGIRGEFECCAPFGLDDLFGLVVRPNKRQITRAIYEAKVER
jgi:hypothetical protein